MYNVHIVYIENQEKLDRAKWAKTLKITQQDNQLYSLKWFLDLYVYV